jgi:putative glycosyltransferase (TIGR04372 family)
MLKLYKLIVILTKNPSEFKQVFYFLIHFLNNKRFFVMNLDRVGNFPNDAATYFINNRSNKEKNILVFPKSYKLFQVANHLLLDEIILKFKNENFKYVKSDIIFRIVESQARKNILYKRFFFSKSSKYYNFVRKKKYRFVRAHHTATSIGEQEKNFTFLNKSQFILKHKNRIKKIFDKINFDNKNYICSYTRDSEYLKKLSRIDKIDYSYHNYRDDKYEKLSKAINYLNKKKISAVRIGNIKRKVSKKYFNKNHYDYKFNLKKNYEDALIISSCKFLLCDTSGISAFADLFGIPIAKYNWIPIFNSVRRKTIVTPMLFKSIVDNKYINFFKAYEVLKSNNAIFNKKNVSYEDLGIKLVLNTENEILDTASEINNRVDKNNFTSWNSHQTKYESKMKKIGFSNPGLISNNFIKKYYYLFN